MGVSPSEYTTDPISFREESMPYIRHLITLVLKKGGLADGGLFDNSRSAITEDGARYRYYVGPISDGRPILHPECVAEARRDVLGHGAPSPGSDEGPLTLDEFSDQVLEQCIDDNDRGCDLFREFARHLTPGTHFFVEGTCWGEGGDRFWVDFYDSEGRTDSDSGRAVPNDYEDRGNWDVARRRIATRMGVPAFEGR